MNTASSVASRSKRSHPSTPAKSTTCPICRWSARSPPTQETAQVIDVDALVTDFDGVHTDDGAYVDEDGNEQVRVHRGDGMGVSRLVKSGLPVMILSKERNPVVTRRAEKLHVDVTQGVDNKSKVLQSWIEEQGLDATRVAYVGNDINDLEAFDVVGWPIAVADAHPKVLAAARVVLDRPGGKGAVREVCDLIPVPDQATQQLPTRGLTSVLASDSHNKQPSIPQQQPLLTNHAEGLRTNRKQVS